MSAPKPVVLVVDDSPDTLEVLERNLASRGLEVLTAPGVRDALRALQARGIDLVVTDLKMPEINGLDLVRHIHANCPDTAVLMITGFPSVESAVQAVKAGAEDFLAKPFTDEELMRAVNGALERLEARRAIGREAVPVRHGLIGDCEAMAAAVRRIEPAAASSAPVLIVGESGTGRELVARTIHYSGQSAEKPFLVADLAAIPPERVGAELLGPAGLLRLANGGTLFIRSLELASAALQDGLAAAVAGDLRTRIIASAHPDLPARAGRGAFRSELLAALSGIRIDLPPLRERGDDILKLVRHFAGRAAVSSGRPPCRFSDGAALTLRDYDWPGNVRELEDVVGRLVARAAPRDVIELSDLPTLMRFSILRDHSPLRTLESVENEHIERVLEATDGNRTRAADILGIDRKTLREKMKRLARPDEP